MELSDILETEDDHTYKQRVNRPGDIIGAMVSYEKYKSNKFIDNRIVAQILSEHGMNDTLILCVALLHDIVVPNEDVLKKNKDFYQYRMEYKELNPKFSLNGIVPICHSIGLTIIQSAKILYAAKISKQKNSARHLDIIKNMVTKGWGKFYGKKGNYKRIRDPVNDAIHKSINKLISK